MEDKYSASGYQNNFVESECLKDFECPLCLYVTREPSLTSCCGQHFCRACISKVLSDYIPACPLCKDKEFSTMLDKKQKRRVLDLKVYCDKKNAGCDWTGILGEADEHAKKTCLFIFLDCVNCEVRILKKYLAEHQTKNCPKRPYNCEYCQLKGTYHEIQEDHLPVCPNYPVFCPNECDVAILGREELEQHLRECPLALVECELKEMGCEEKMQQKDLDRHMEEAAQKHVQLMASYNVKAITALKGDHLALKDDHLELKKELAVKNKEIVDLKQKLAHTSLSLEMLRLELKPTISQASQAVAFMKTSFIQIYVRSFSSLKERETCWGNPEVFHTFPSRHKMAINLDFHSDRISIMLTHLLSEHDMPLTWPKYFTMTLRMLNQEEDSGHFQVTRNLSVYYDCSNGDTFIKYNKISSGGGKYLLNDSLRLEALISEA